MANTIRRSVILIASLSLSQFAFAKTDLIQSKAKTIGQIAAGGYTMKRVSGKTADEILKKYASLREGLTAQITFENDAPMIPMTDASVWGTTGVRSAVNFVTDAVNYKNEGQDGKGAPYTKAATSMMKRAVADLANSGAVFAWNPTGNGNCGANLSSLLIIDPIKSRVYEIDFYGKLSC